MDSYILLYLAREYLGYDDKKVEIDLESIIVEDTYSGPRLDGGLETITSEWVVSVMDHLKN